MKWKKLSKTTRILVVVFAVLLLCGTLPLLLVDHSSASSEDNHEISHLVEKLEIEHQELIALIATLEAENKAKLAKPRTSPLLTAPTAEHTNAVDTGQGRSSKPEVNVIAPVAPAAAGESQTYRRPITFNTPSSKTAQSILVVGGTDGSGTRRVVQILTQLGVTMVSEDPETYDIHGDIVGGWPTVVRPVLEHTENIAYEPSDLPDHIQTKIAGSLQKLLDLVDSDSRKAESHTLAVGGVLRKALNIDVSGVKYGFKAPVAMTLAPFWAHLLNDFRMLHVLRDGRDIAFSANQGPVVKFYDTMYKKRDIATRMERVELKAVRLWSDWNLGLKVWAEKKVEKYSSDPSNSPKSFGYYALHSEDLVDEDRDVRHSALVNLAAWVGSDIGDKDLCCIAVSGSKFLGSHDRTSPVAKEALTSRYGKWKKKLAADRPLSDALFSLGGPALKTFGYEPLRGLASEQLASEQEEPAYSNFKTVVRPRCVLLPGDCTVAPLGRNTDHINPQLWAVEKMCTVEKGVDYKGGDLSLFTMAAAANRGSDRTECCRRCAALPGCRHFTADTDSGLCYLKSSKASTVRTGMTAGLVSGDML